MKKIFKKVMIVLTVLLLFTTVLPNKADKEADASISMTLAGIAATVGGSAMLPYALGAAGVLAVGGVIKNWDVVKDYGEKVIARMGGYDAASGSYVENPDGTATVIYSPAMKAAMANAVDDIDAQISVTGANAINVGNHTFDNSTAAVKTVSVGSIPAGYKLRLTFDYSATGANEYGNSASPYAQYYSNESGGWVSAGNLYTVLKGTSISGRFDRDIMDAISTAREGVQFRLVDYPDYGRTTTFTNIKYTVYKDASDLVSNVYDTSDTFGSVADNVNARLLGMNAAISDGQAVTFSADAELLNASIDDLASISDATLTETQTQTGILSQIWRSITNLPNSIASAGVAAAAAINAKAEDLWADAGAVWSGLADTATGIRADINAKMGALQDAMAGGIDNVRSGINDMIAGLNAGIDTMANNWAAWGQLTLDGIDAGVGAITTGLTNTWTNIKTGITEGVGAITGSITTAMDDINTWITDFPTTMLRVFVPPNFDFMQPLITATTSTLQLKFGPLETLPNVFRNIFGAGKSIYDIEITVLGHTYKIVPIFLKPVIDGARPFLTGAINLMSLTILYRRYKGNLVIPT